MSHASRSHLSAQICPSPAVPIVDGVEAVLPYIDALLEAVHSQQQAEAELDAAWSRMFDSKEEGSDVPLPAGEGKLLSLPAKVRLCKAWRSSVSGVLCLLESGGFVTWSQGIAKRLADLDPVAERDMDCDFLLAEEAAARRIKRMLLDVLHHAQGDVEGPTSEGPGGDGCEDLAGRVEDSSNHAETGPPSTRQAGGEPEDGDGKAEQYGRPRDSSNKATFLSAADLAERNGLEEQRGALDKRLQRWRFQNGNGWIEVPDSDRRPRDPKYLYAPAAVQSVINGLKSAM